MRVLIANPPTVLGDRVYCAAGARWPAKRIKTELKYDPNRYAPFPFFLAYTSALLKREGHKVNVIDAATLQMQQDEFLHAVNQRKPEMVVIETSTPTINLDLAYSKMVKELTGSKIMLVGPHASLFPAELLQENVFVDYIGVGEYEFTVLDVANALDKGQSVENVLSLGFRNGTVKVNPKRIAPDINLLPYPDRDAFPIDNDPDVKVYWDGFCELDPCVQMVASRGCPFNCDFCLWTQIMYPGRRFRRFDVARVVDEIEHVVEKYGAKEIYFDDDTITGHREHIVEISNEISRRGLDVPWCAMTDSMVTTREMLQAMAKAGCVGVKFGVESANPQVLKNIDKPIKLEKTLQYAKWCREFEMKTHATFSFGLTGETRESMQETLKFACKLDVDTVQFSVTIPYPGTRFYETAKQNGWLVAKGWEDFDGRPVVSYPNLPLQEITEFHSKAQPVFNRAKVRNPVWVMRRAMRTLKYKGPKDFVNLAKRGMKYLV